MPVEFTNAGADLIEKITRREKPHVVKPSRELPNEVTFARLKGYSGIAMGVVAVGVVSPEPEKVACVSQATTRGNLQSLGKFRKRRDETAANDLCPFLRAAVEGSINLVEGLARKDVAEVVNAVRREIMKLAVAPHEATNGFCLGSEVGSYLLEVESGRKCLIEQRLKLGFLGHIDFHE
jgi:hypothetical protein